MSDIVSKVAGLVEDHLKHEGTGHDWQHIYRVWQTAAQLAEAEGADETVVGLASLLHDVDDYKVAGEQAEKDLPTTRQLLKEVQADDALIEQVCDVLKSVGFRKTLAGGAVERSLEAHVLSDADMLDALGAVGIARTFTYCGGKGFGMYDPERLPESALTKEGYMKGGAPSVTHFFEKLLKLKGMMFTEAGKKEAEVRHGRMVLFLDQFFEEAKAPKEWVELLAEYR